MGRQYLVLNVAKQRTRTGRSGSAPEERRNFMDLQKEWGAEHIGKSACRVTRIGQMQTWGMGLYRSMARLSIHNLRTFIHKHMLYLPLLYLPIPVS